MDILINSPPLTRGLTAKCYSSFDVVVLSPAHAGINRCGYVHLGVIEALPRSRGD